MQELDAKSPASLCDGEITEMFEFVSRVKTPTEAGLFGVMKTLQYKIIHSGDVGAPPAGMPRLLPDSAFALEIR
ncbi:MAG: hypothetical protein ACE5KM_06325 [Planctomycetaceae bacterium]